MAGYVVTGRGDLDAIFVARTSAKRADVGYAIGGVDISNNYEPIGGATPGAPTGFMVAGVDLSQYFRPQGGAGPLAAMASPDLVSGNCQAGIGGSCIATTAAATCTAGGGTPPYSYWWELVSGPGHNPVNASSATTTFQRSDSVADPPKLVDSVFRCRVTDSGSQVVYTNNITVRTRYVQNA